MIELRDYQTECNRTLWHRYMKNNQKKLLVVLPTGAGKTVVFSSFIDKVFKGNKTLVIAHREELLKQTQQKYMLVAGKEAGLKVGFVTGQQKDFPFVNPEFEKDLYIAGVQTISRLKNLLKFPRDYFDLIVVDEAHHVTANTYLKVLKYFGVRDIKTKQQFDFEKGQGLISDNKEPLLLGFTATPYRTDKREIGSVFESITYSKNIHWMIQNKYLVPIVPLRVRTKIDLKSIRFEKGDYNENELNNAINVDSLNVEIVETYKRLCYTGDKNNLDPCVVFALNKAHADQLCIAFEKADINAGCITDDTTRDDRKATLKAFEKGEIKVITNCMVLTEGTDLPNIKAIIMARPTASEGLYIQCIGRGLRLHPDKKFCKVIDIAHQNTHPRIIDLENVLRRSIEEFDIEKIKKEKEEEFLRPDMEIAEIWNQINMLAYSKEAGACVSVEVENISIIDYTRKFIWSTIDDSKFIVITNRNGEREKVEIKGDELQGFYNVYSNNKPLLDIPCDFNWAFGFAEQYLHQAADTKVLQYKRSDARWLNDPPTEKQIESIQNAFTKVKIDIDYNDLKLFTKGELSIYLDQIFESSHQYRGALSRGEFARNYNMHKKRLMCMYYEDIEPNIKDRCKN